MTMKPPPDFGVDERDLVELVVPNDLSAARQAEGQILAAMDGCGYDPDTTFGLKLSLEEALTNAIKHGNRNDPSKKIHLKYYVGPERVVVMVRDEGPGFSPDSLPDPTARENLERPNGRGIMLMQSYMTKVRFNETGNEVWLLKERESKGDQADS